MPIVSAYRDFLRFLARLGKGRSAWELYQVCYLDHYRDFLLSYWSNFASMDLEQIRKRVERVKRNDYSNLESLLRTEEPEEIVRRALQRCGSVAPVPKEPTIYLMVGFFSSEGFVIRLKGKPVIGIGLERFRDLSSLGLILAHEYCHYLRSSLHEEVEPGKGKTLGEMLLSEGLSAFFSQLVFPEKPLYDHLLITRARYNWCVENEDYLTRLAWSEFDSPRLVPVFFKMGSHKLGIAPRAGIYLGYSLLRDHQDRTGATFSQLLGLKCLPDE